MGKVKNPIICGRRNCTKCGRWRHTIDFKWSWRNPEYRQKPTISSVCDACRRAKERERYHSLPAEERRQRIKDAVESKRRREARRSQQIAAAQERDNAKFNQAGYVDIVPFRMWLLLKARTNGDDLAQRAKVTSSRLNEWLEGCTWTGHYCEPTPIRSIALRTVEDVTTRLGEPEAAAMLYPLEY